MQCPIHAAGLKKNVEKFCCGNLKGKFRKICSAPRARSSPVSSHCQVTFPPGMYATWIVHPEILLLEDIFLRVKPCTFPNCKLILFQDGEKKRHCFSSIINYGCGFATSCCLMHAIIIDSSPSSSDYAHCSTSPINFNHFCSEAPMTNLGHTIFFRPFELIVSPGLGNRSGTLVVHRLPFCPTTYPSQVHFFFQV